MKNRKFERNRKLQKQYGATHSQRMAEGITVRHVYGEHHDFKKSWWDDTGFILNGTYIAIWWVHPRMEFSDAVDTIAHDNVPSPDHDLDIFSDTTKIYKKVGKSGNRKKIIGYESNMGDRTSFREWYDKLQVEKDRLLKETDLVVKPNLKVESLDWCRGVSICAPIEVHGIPDLKALCDLVKRILKGQTSLENEFPNYTYTKNDWVSENLAEGTPTLADASHALN